MPRVSRRADVRSTAAQLFREHGYSSATMDLIADTVGLNKGTLYHYYPSKSAILFELLADQLDTTMELLAKVPATGTPTERFRELIRLEVTQAAGASDELVVFFQELPWVERNLPAEQASDVLRRVDKYRSFSQKLLKEGIDAGEFRPVNVSIVHYSIVGVLAYIPNWFRPRSGRGKAALVEELTEFVLAGVLATRD
ncbi:TetR/AcrR family transcriptional regulator [Mumia sp. Pv 4-285]|uniref:TetR/AcrR family transcriptional regulator n=1 Tax=Mumia qirimensis TaxID=3234852 RepID=UPI00351D5623